MAAGTYLRFTGLSRQILENDEAWTSLWISGHSYGEMQNDLCGRVGSAQEFGLYLDVSPGRGLFRTISALAADDPKQSPIYYGLLRLWVQAAGDSLGAMRILSVLFGLAVLPAAYLLARELFDPPAAAWLAVALIAVSPAHILYSQDLRPYSLYTAMALLSSWALLRAMRMETSGGWRLYAATVIAGLYIHALIILALAAHCAYAFVCYRRAGRMAPFVRSLLWAALAFLPWTVVFLFGWRRGLGGMRWLLSPIPLRYLFESWMTAWGRAFVDVTELHLEASTAPWLPLAIYVTVMGLVVASFAYLWRTTSRRTWALPLLLFVTPLLVLVPPDIVLGGQSSAIDRYLVSGYLGAELAVAGLLAAIVSRKGVQCGLGIVFLTVLLSAGIYSSWLNSETAAPWIKGPARDYRRMAPVLNEAEHPLLVCDCASIVRLLSFSPFLRAGVSMELLRKSEPLIIPQGPAPEVFLFRGPAGSELDGRFVVEPTPGGDQLWRLLGPQRRP